MPILTALGAKCTVLDYSDQQLESERLVAECEGYDIDIVKADMTQPLPFADESFDMIIQPVANCYVEKPNFHRDQKREIAKAAKFELGGFLLSSRRFGD